MAETRLGRTAVSTTLAFASAALFTMATAQPAVAEGPARAKLSTALSGSSGAWADAYYTDTMTATKVVKWPGTYAYGSLAAGTPCETYDVPVGYVTEKVIIATGSYRKCA